MSDPDPTDAERFPTLSEEGARLLSWMREHPSAPRFRNESGNRLTADDVAALRAFERDTLDATLDPVPGREPAWLAGFIHDVYADVPHYRRLGSPPARLADVPTIDRGDLAADIARFVPDAVPLARLINFRTTGTTGQPLLVASHPRVAGSYLAFHKRALRRFGITLTHGRGQVGVVLLGHQRRCFTYVSVTPLMDDSGLAKINLHPDDWTDPGDRARYLDALAPEVLAGDPISFAELLTLPVTLRPRALVSVSMALSPALRAALAARFDCPVLDVYSLNEAGPVAVFDDAAGGHVLLQPRLHVEVLDADGRAVAPGERGEIALTGGFNFCLPLLRYRTGDHASLGTGIDAPVLRGLAGRRPVRFRTAGGEWINNIDVTHALGGLPLSRFALRQAAYGAVTLRLAPGDQAHAPAAIAALQALLGNVPITLGTIDADDKIVQYDSTVPGAMS
jgi:phenylacetate-CoA ligase